MFYRSSEKACRSDKPPAIRSTEHEDGLSSNRTFRKGERGSLSSAGFKKKDRVSTHRKAFIRAIRSAVLKQGKSREGCEGRNKKKKRNSRIGGYRQKG